MTVNGYDVVNQSMEVREMVGYLPEHNPLYTDMYIKEFLEFVGRIHLPKAEAVKRTKEMIELTGLGVEQHKKIGALSKGYRQRVGLAQAMIHNPSVLILDEPTTGLDPNQLVEIRALIRSIGKEKTVILSTHIMQEVEAICDRVLIINKGKIVADDTSSVLRKQAEQGNVIHVEFDKAANEVQLSRIKGVLSVHKEKDKCWRIESEANIDIRPELFKFAVDHQLTVMGLQKDEGNLESVFRQLTVNK